MSTDSFTALRSNDDDSHDDAGGDCDNDNGDEKEEHLPWPRSYAGHLP